MLKRQGTKRRVARMMMLALAVTMCSPASTEAKNMVIKANTKNVSVSLYTGKKLQLQVAGKKKVSWLSKNRKVAVVSKTGKLTAKKAGTTQVIGSVKGSKKKITCKVRVGNYIKGIKLQSASSVTLSMGQSSQIQAAVIGKNPLDSGFTYVSSNPSIAKVSKTGKITSVGAGLTEITVKTKAVNAKGKSYSAKVNVYVPSDAPKATLAPSITGNSKVVSGTAAGVSFSAEQNLSLTKAVEQVPSPEQNQLVAGTFVVSENNAVYTVYLLNHNYSGKMQLSVFGYPLSSSKTVTEALRIISSVENTSTYIFHEGKKVLDLTDQSGNCSVQDLATKEIVKFQVFQTDPVCKTSYGMIIAEGDTRDKILVK